MTIHGESLSDFHRLCGAPFILGVDDALVGVTELPAKCSQAKATGSEHGHRYARVRSTTAHGRLGQTAATPLDDLRGSHPHLFVAQRH